MEERIQKIISAHGVTSRRKAEEMIKAGMVTVNGETATLGTKADDERDEIKVCGKPLEEKVEYIYVMLNKPVGYVTTMSDEHGRKTVCELVSSIGTRVYPVGRLDINSEGLLLLTNDGEFANKIMHPSFEKEKTYEVKVTGDVKTAEPKLRAPMVIDGYEIKPADVKIKHTFQNGGIIEVTIHEGRNRQVRKMCEAVCLKVLKLKRISIGTLKLGDLKTGEWRYLSKEEMNCFL